MLTDALPRLNIDMLTDALPRLNIDMLTDALPRLNIDMLTDALPRLNIDMLTDYYFWHWHVKGFSSKCTALKVDALSDRKTYCVQACP